MSITAFPGTFRPHLLPSSTQKFTLSKLSDATEAASCAAHDLAGATRRLLQGGSLAEGDHVLSGETLTSVLEAAINILDLRSRSDDRALRQAIQTFLANEPGGDDAA